MPNYFKSVKDILLGKARDINDPHLFTKISLIAFFAWIGLGADGLSSSCYGPEEAFLALGNYRFLGLFMALATVFTILITCLLAIFCFMIKSFYRRIKKRLMRFDILMQSGGEKTISGPRKLQKSNIRFASKAKTAVISVNGFNGMGLHTFFNIIKVFGNIFKNVFFIQVGIIDAGIFKGNEELAKLEEHIKGEVNRYVEFVKGHGLYARGYTAVGIDAVEKLCELADTIYQQYPQSIFFGGQMILRSETIFSKLLLNYTTFALQKRLHYKGIPFVIMPAKI